MRKESHHAPICGATLLVLATSVACAPAKASISAEPPGTPNTAVVTQEQLEHMKVATEVVDLRDIDDTIVASGKITYDDQRVVHVYSPVSGRIGQVFVQLGSRVQKNAPLATIESPDIGSATSDVSKAKADLIAAEQELARQKELLDLHAASQKDFDQAAGNYRQKKAELERAQQKSALFQHGDVVGQSYTLRSDLEGEVFMKAVSPGTQISGQYGGSSVELFTIGETNKVWVLADVFELDVPRVKIGAKAVVSVVSWPDRKFEGTVDWISGALDSTTHATRVRCSFDNADGVLKPEMFTTVKFSVNPRKAIAIPRSSVLRLGDQTVVFIDRGKDERGRERFDRIPVSVDEGQAKDRVAVDQGVQKGDRIVTEGAILLAGMI
jgi:cobalt-zinc-cadmium efflux system membrane fusion protein